MRRLHPLSHPDGPNLSQPSMFYQNRQDMISRARSRIAYGGRSRAGGGPSYGGASASVGVTRPDVIRMGTSASRLFPMPGKLTLSRNVCCRVHGCKLPHQSLFKKVERLTRWVRFRVENEGDHLSSKRDCISVSCRHDPVCLSVL